MGNIKYIILIIFIYINILESGLKDELHDLQLDGFIPIKTIGLQKTTRIQLDRINYNDIWKAYNNFLSDLGKVTYKLDKKTFIKFLETLYHQLFNVPFIDRMLEDITKYPEFFQVTINWGLRDLHFKTGAFTPACSISFSITSEKLLKIKEVMKKDMYFNPAQQLIYLNSLKGKIGSVVYDVYKFISEEYVKSLNKVSKQDIGNIKSYLRRMMQYDNSWDFKKYKRLKVLNRIKDDEEVVFSRICKFYLENTEVKDKHIHDFQSEDETQMLNEVLLKYDELKKNHALSEVEVMIRDERKELTNTLNLILIKLDDINLNLKEREIEENRIRYIISQIYTLSFCNAEDVYSTIVTETEGKRKHSKYLDQRDKTEEIRLKKEKEKNDQKLLEQAQRRIDISNQKERKKREVEIQYLIDKQREKLKQELSILSYQDLYKISLQIEEKRIEVRLMNHIGENKCSKCIKEDEINSMIKEYGLRTFIDYFQKSTIERITADEHKIEDKKKLEVFNKEEKDRIENKQREDQENYDHVVDVNREVRRKKGTKEYNRKKKQQKEEEEKELQKELNKKKEQKEKKEKKEQKEKKEEQQKNKEREEKKKAKKQQQKLKKLQKKQQENEESLIYQEKDKQLIEDINREEFNENQNYISDDNGDGMNNYFEEYKNKEEINKETSMNFQVIESLSDSIGKVKKLI